MVKNCISCGKDVATISKSVIFKCPKCGDDIVRCGYCRKLSVQYKCPKCSFEGL